MKFNYKARTKEGKVETGTIEASSKESASLLLQKYNIFVTSLEEQGASGPILRNVRFELGVSKKDLAIFSRQLAVMLESRIPVIQSLTSLASQTKKNNFKEVINKVAVLVEEGEPISDAFAKFPKVYDNFYVNLIRSGEVSGKISETLYYLSDHLERESDIISQVRGAMIYPILVISVLFIVIGIVIVVVMPRITDLIKESETNPPFFTVLMIGMYAFIAQYWWIILLVVIFLTVVVILYFRTEGGRKNFDRWSLRIPLVGDVLQKVFLTRFCENVSTLIAAGISINKALAITENTVNNVVYKDIVHTLGKEVSEGEKMSTVLEKYKIYFPSFVVQMIKVGEDTGTLEKTLMEVVKFYQKEITRAINLFSTLLEPILIIFLGIVVGLIGDISIVSPIWFAGLGVS
ncbi:MAG: type II secretion system F family protein, partial [Candidatus Paceibacterales bacterium]